MVIISVSWTLNTPAEAKLWTWSCTKTFDCSIAPRSSSALWLIKQVIGQWLHPSISTGSSRDWVCTHSEEVWYSLFMPLFLQVHMWMSKHFLDFLDWMIYGAGGEMFFHEKNLTSKEASKRGWFSSIITWYLESIVEECEKTFICLRA